MKKVCSVSDKRIQLMVEQQANKNYLNSECRKIYCSMDYLDSGRYIRLYQIERDLWVDFVPVRCKGLAVPFDGGLDPTLCIHIDGIFDIRDMRKNIQIIYDTHRPYRERYLYRHTQTCKQHKIQVNIFLITIYVVPMYNHIQSKNAKLFEKE